jgi:peroxiredoxin
VYPGPADGLDDRAKEFVSGKNLPEGFHFVLDPDMKAISAWGLRWDAANETAYPATFVIAPDGKVRFAKVSQSHGDRATGEDILAAMKAIAK